MSGSKRNEKRNESEPKPRTNKRGDTRGMTPASQENLKPIQPGEVRNPKGWPKGKRHTDTLYELSMQRFELIILDKINEGRKAKNQAALTIDDAGVDPELDMWLKQLEKARNGDTKAFEIINAYRHGKPTARVQVSGDPDNPIQHEVSVAEIEAEVDEWIEGWFNPVQKTKVTVKKKAHGNSKTKGSE